VPPLYPSLALGLLGSYLNIREAPAGLEDASSGHGDMSGSLADSSRAAHKVHRNGPPVDHGHWV